MNWQRYMQIIAHHLSHFTQNQIRENTILIQDNASWNKKRECVDLLKTFNIKWVKNLEKLNVINKNHLTIFFKGSDTTLFARSKYNRDGME